MSVISFVNRNVDSVRRGSQLSCSIDYASIVFSVSLSREDKQTVRELLHGFRVNLCSCHSSFIDYRLFEARDCCRNGFNQCVDLGFLFRLE